ncbi:MAG TPA: FecR domain-containing protein [Chitinophaga sp.]|uniref:FecR family protein n=1 Tax=Chitinophaga sp. TaxID=1869181 RepID=UPI002CC6EBE4|nr:FecR domain-containing protein [Chitinophaga sp.]HVI45717.1 FecR domain-containing protein [Chitinophaga sp.]
MQEQRLKHLLRQRLSGTETPAGKEELYCFLQQEDNREICTTILSELMMETPPATDIDTTTWQPLLEHIIATDKTTPVTIPVHRRLWWSWAAAAVTIGVLAGCLYYFWKPSTTEKPPAPVSLRYHNEVAPGGNKAVLTLSDGSVIQLDDAQNGTLGKQGNAQVVKLRSGQLAYQPAGTATAVSYNTLSTPKGGQYQVALPDGTIVWLNAASSLHYPTAFTGSERTVELTGEGYFEVAPLARQPFHVKVNGADVTVLGTHFNIMAYTNEKTMKVTLLEGAVNVSAGGAARRLIPQQQAVVQNAAISVANVDTDQETAWKNGFFIFDKADIQTVMRQLERWYNIDVTYEGIPPSLRFAGGMQRNLPLTKVLKILEQNQVRFSIEGRHITVLK